MTAAGVIGAILRDAPSLIPPPLAGEGREGTPQDEDREEALMVRSASKTRVSNHRAAWLGAAA
jgi:hypothetical protein